MKTITIELRPEDAEPILRQAAYEAALYGGRWDYINRRTYNYPGSGSLEDLRAGWKERFLKGKRMVEAFGIEYEQTSEEEAMTISYPYTKNEKVKIVNLGPPLGSVRVRSGGETDWKKPTPTYRGGVHETAAHAAADRVVQKWKAAMAELTEA
jgi:hypothetical protein